MKNFIEEVTWRGMLHDVMPGTEEHLMEQMRVAYVGIDPTADSLHIGHLVGVMLLRHFQLSGHKPLALVGTVSAGMPSWYWQWCPWCIRAAVLISAFR